MEQQHNETRSLISTQTERIDEALSDLAGQLSAEARKLRRLIVLSLMLQLIVLSAVANFLSRYLP